MIFNASLVETSLRYRLETQSPALYAGKLWSGFTRLSLYISKVRVFTKLTRERKMWSRNVVEFHNSKFSFSAGYNLRRLGLGLVIDRYGITLDIGPFWLELMW